MNSNGISEETRTLLANQGFVDKDSLSVLQQSDIPTLKIKPLAQRRLLERLLARLTADTSTSSRDSQGVNTDDAPVRTLNPPVMEGTRLDQLSAAGTPLDQLGLHVADQGQATLPTSSVGAVPGQADAAPLGTGLLQGLGIDNHMNSAINLRGDLNPLVYLADNKRSGHLDIVDFVPLLMSNESQYEQVLSSQNGNEIVLKSGTKKLKLDSVSPMQWTAANAKIMAKLLLEGKLGSDHVANYLAYTVKVSNLAQKYTWQSVLVYDREYRHFQAIHKFLWGSDIPHLISVHLVPKTVKPTFPAKKEDKYPVSFKSIPCKLFNHSQCHYGAKCKFGHICSVCKGPHAQPQHPE